MSEQRWLDESSPVCICGQGGITLSEVILDTAWNYTQTNPYRRKIAEGMPPLIITCAVSGDHQKSENPNIPVTAEEQAEEAAQVYAAGASIIHIHGREESDPSKTSSDAKRYYQINAMMRAKAPDIVIDNTQTATAMSIDPGQLLGTALRYKSAPLEAKPEIMALNPGPMTFRGHPDNPSAVLVTTFDDTLRAAMALRENGIKPQVFLYHPGHLDIMEYLIQHDALARPYFVQLVFGQQSGIATSPDNLLLMVRNLPEGAIFQTCALGLEAVHVNTLAILLGGHVRTGLEDNLWYQQGELAQSNVQLVERIARIAKDLGRRVATGPEARQMLGIGAPSAY
jgi:3-keto-5-aminohexanoate cleavage enzyme